MKKLFLGLTLVSVFVAGGITANSYLGVASAQDGGSVVTYDKFEGKRASGENHRAMMNEDVNRETTNIENGVVIKVTSSDSETVKLIQERQEQKKNTGSHWSNSDVSKNVENIDNGVQMTLTSDDPETVKSLQERSVSEKGSFGGRGGQGKK